MKPITTVDIETRTLPLAESFPTSYGDLPTDHCYVRVRDGEFVGYGEGAARNCSANAIFHRSVSVLGIVLSHGRTSSATKPSDDGGS